MKRAPQVTFAGSEARRSRLYALLSTAYRYPTAELCDAVASGQFQRLVQSTTAGLPYPLPMSSIPASPNDPQSFLPEAYPRLFDVGSLAGPPCSLYEGQYGGGRLGVMEDLLRFYHFFGLRLSPMERDRPDHLATELEFLHWLTFQQATTHGTTDTQAASSYAAATRDFLATHVRDLAVEVGRRLGNDDTPFYPSLARLAAAVCEHDLAYLNAGGCREPSGSPQIADNQAGPQLHALQEVGEVPRPYDIHALRAFPLKWDRIVKASHLTGCAWNRCCNYNLYVSDGVVLREEQVGNYPPPNNPAIPDPNPRGCQKGACYAHRTYDPARLKYPLKRVGARGEGRWRRLDWNEALTEIADQLIDVLTTEGPEVVIQGGGARVHGVSSEGMGTNGLFEALGSALAVQAPEEGDDHQGAAVTMGKVMFADSPDNWFYADMLLAWGGNPAYSNIPGYHYIAEARYHGVRVVVISPDYNASAIHADLWVPLNIGTDGALALGMAHVIVRDGLYQADFVREQTDLPLLVRTDTGKFLREKDVKRDGREDIFFVYDQATGRVVEAPRKSLALDGLVPALEGEYQVKTLQGTVVVRPVFELLRSRLIAAFTPEQVASITGISPALIERLAREIATARGVICHTTALWGKFYHGDLIERSIILVFALCGHMGHKGASFNAFNSLFPDTGVGKWERQGHQMLQSAAGTDPRYAAWKADGYTTEMIFTEYMKEAFAAGKLGSTAMVHLFHGGLLDLSRRYQSWDPHLKRTVTEYVTEALDKGWHVVVPPPDKEPRIMFQWGGDVFRRTKGTDEVLRTLLPKLQLLVTVDWRMNATALYSDYVLPVCGWYERISTNVIGSVHSPFLQVNDKAVEPLWESVSDWAIAVRLARKLAQRARERGVVSYRDLTGKERRLDRLEDIVTVHGLYDEDDEEGVARDVFVNSGNREQIEWEEFKERGIAAYVGVGTGVQALGHACDLEVGEPIVPLTWHTERKQPYPTLTRRIQFFIDHDWYQELEEDLPTHKDCPKTGGDYPLQLTSGHARWSIHSDWTDDALILALQRGEPAMFMSPEDATPRGIQDGDFAEVHNDVASFRIQAIVSPAVRPGQVIVYHGWANYQFQGWRHFKSVMGSGLNPIELVGAYGHLREDPLTLGPGLSDRGTRVEVARTGEVRS